jgi:hypothetical protein
MLKSLAVATLGLALAAGPAAAQDSGGMALVAAQLDAVVNEFALTAGDRATGRLGQDGSHVARLRSPGGVIYIVGVCDENCSDLDIVVRDSSGREVAEDLALDDFPMVHVQSNAEVYSVEVRMATCDGQCNWGVGLFR